MIVRKGYVDTCVDKTEGQLHYRYCGDGEVIVFLQLLPLASLMFDPVLPLFASRGYRCYAFDFMGYGRSDKTVSEWVLDDHADSMQQAFSGIGIKPKYIVGGHFGGLVSVELAERMHDSVEKLVLDGVPLWSEEQRQERLHNTPPPESFAEDGSTVNTTWHQACQSLQHMDPEAAVFSESTENIYMDVFMAIMAMKYKPGKAKAFFSFDTLNKLATINTSTMVIGSSTDTLSSYHEGAVELIPNCRSHFFENTHPLYKITRNRCGEGLSDYVDLLDAFFQS